jgi:hypothetical protein
MRRFGRRMSDVLTGLSLLLFVAATALWARSYRFEDILCLWDADGELALSSQRGLICVSASNVHGPPGHALIRWPAHPPTELRPSPLAGGSLFNRLGFAHDARLQRGGYVGLPLELQNRGLIVPDPFVSRLYVLPFWAVCALAGALPVLRWALCPLRRGIRSKLRRRHGLCPRCGYDLRATPDRCPECGHVPARHSHASTTCRG